MRKMIEREREGETEAETGGQRRRDIHRKRETESHKGDKHR